MSTADLARRMQKYRASGAKQALIGLSDIDGVLRGKFVDLHKLESLMEKGGGFCDCVFGWDVNDQLYDNGRYTGWHTGFPDADYRLITATERMLPDRDVPYFLGEFVGQGGTEHALCPRSLLRRTVERLADHGLTVKAGFEYEFFVFNEDPETVRAKQYRDLRPLTPGNFGYSVLRTAAKAEMFTGLMDYCREFGFPLEGLHCETGPGVWEGAFEIAEGLEAADRAMLFKTFAKAYFQQRSKLATFMAKWSMAYPGQSGHFHFSLYDKNGNNVLAADKSGRLSHTTKSALGGLATYIPQFLPMLAPTINSYTRLVRGAWAPTAATWGIENRTAAFRVITGSADRQHIENRVGGADANPYLVAAATLGAVLLGITEKIDPGEPVEGNAYELEGSLDEALCFESSLRDSARRFDASSAARALFGNEFVSHFVGTRLWEASERDRNIDDWQLSRYLEII